MAKNEFKPFAISNGANVTSQTEYETLPALSSGFQAGKASSAQINKSLRQASVIASVVAQFIANTNNEDVLDDGDVSALQQSLLDALKQNAADNIPKASTSAAGIVKLSSETGSSDETTAATPKAVKAANDNANGRVPSARTVNGKALSANITLSAGDVGAYTKAESDTVLANKLSNAVTTDTAQSISGAKIFTGGFQDITTQLGRLTSAQPVALTAAAQLNAMGMGATLFINAVGSDATLMPGGATSGYWAITCVQKNDTAASSGIYQAIQQSTPEIFYTGQLFTSGVITWRQVVTETATQTISGQKTFTNIVRFLRSGANIALENTNVAEGVIGRVIIAYNNSGSFSVIYDPSSSSTTGRIIQTFPKSASGTVLVSGNNAAVDTFGYWKTPGSAELTPSSLGAISITELAGIPQPFPGAVAPAGWLKCSGQAFNKTAYPILAGRYPTGYLPDLRGEFVRGWDDGRGVDAERVMLSEQGDAIRNITGKLSQVNDRVTIEGTTGVFAMTGYTGSNAGLSGGGAGRIVTFDASTVVPTSTENRPRNIAFNYIVRAA